MIHARRMRPRIGWTQKFLSTAWLQNKPLRDAQRSGRSVSVAVQARVSSTRVELDAARLQQATGTPRRGADTSGMECGVAERAVEHGIANFSCDDCSEH